MRCGFTIIYEGVHHLQHKQFAEKMAEMFDHWIVVEGHALPFGSTKWCNKLNVAPTSTDSTVAFMKDFASKHKNVHFYSHGRYFTSKDEQVNVANKCYLWEVDADEHWRLADLEKAEAFADRSKEIGFSFNFSHYLGEGIVAKGEWGSGSLNRLWKWSGQNFKSHEPALLVNQRRTEPIPDVTFEHYSYMFDKDVQFKSLYYSGHQNVFKNIHSVRNAPSYPIHISALFGKETKIGKSNSYIYKIA
jgi:hypothetical protein